ncbi:uncharacterized protein LDX57_010280 [Aspergillus melleus]|uniref:uncharacterized protein n=1 Tax=Aspergillus melleus TaxID=138277 RepID=UPI001E8D1269|nr:uncharacterized protein LDX57_010280 [Aspergillus melleus]KAH8432653.1 hypothetical protein LDX57_010280 [Aspergillus melleus]
MEQLLWTVTELLQAAQRLTLASFARAVRASLPPQESPETNFPIVQDAIAIDKLQAGPSS